MNADELAELEEERSFLLRSLEDLEREHEAGDVDDEDYHTLRDGYVVRSAATIRAIESGHAAAVAEPATNWWKRLGVAAFGVGLIAVLWWGFATFSAQRLSGQQITGIDPRSEIEVLRSEARSMQFQQPGQAAQVYQMILDQDPDDANALTYGGWTTALAAVSSDVDGEVLQDQLLTATEMLSRAIEVDPTYPDPYCLRGVLVARFLQRPDAAVDDLETCLSNNPPADITDLVTPLLEEIRSVTPVTTAAP